MGASFNLLTYVLRHRGFAASNHLMVSKVDVVLAARIAESVEYLRQDVFEKIYSSVG